MSDADLFEGVHRVLLVQLSAIGDVLRAGSVVSTIKRLHPGVRVGMLVFSDYADVMAGIPGLSYRHVFPNTALKRAMNSIRDDDDVLQAVYAHAYTPLQDIQLRNYDLAVNFHFSAASAYLTALSAAKKLLGMAPGPDGRMDVFGAEAGALYEDLRSPDRLSRSKEHLAARYHRMCGLPAEDARLDFQIPSGTSNPLPAASDPSVDLAALPPSGRSSDGKSQWMAVHVGAGWKDKCWPAVFWRELIVRAHREFGWRPVLLGSAVERDRNFSSVLRDLDVPYADICGKSFLESACALSQCRVFAGADSGPMHLASALDVPAVALFGPTSSAESYPLCGRNAVIHRPKMSDIGVEEVWEAVCAVTSRQKTTLPTWEPRTTDIGLILYENPPRPLVARQNVA